MPNPPRPKSSAVRGCLLITLGLGFMAIGIVCLFIVMIDLKSSPSQRPIGFSFLTGMMVFLGAPIFLSLGVSCLNQGRRLAATTHNEDIQARAAATPRDGHSEADAAHQSFFPSDGSPFTLYLRCFGDDPGLAETPAPVVTPSLISFSLITSEEAFAKALHQIGPAFAIGRPGDKAPPLGVKRIYVGDETWQKTVEDGMRKARLVVIRAANFKSDGLWWELKRAAELVKPQHLVILLPFVSKESNSLFTKPDEAYETFRATTQGFWQHPLPLSYYNRTVLPGILYFSDQWTIVDYTPIKVPMLRRANHYGPLWKMAFEPVYKQIQVPWSPPPINMWKIMPVAVLLALILFMIMVGVLMQLIIANTPRP